MPIFLIQDNDRPMYVVARTLAHAERLWRHVVARENDMSAQDVEMPLGVAFICPDDEMIIDRKYLKEELKR